MTPSQYDVLERAITRGERIAIRRRGAEMVIVPLALRTRGGREFIETRQPTTGEVLTLGIDEIESVEHVR